MANNRSRIPHLGSPARYHHFTSHPSIMQPFRNKWQEIVPRSELITTMVLDNRRKLFNWKFHWNMHIISPAIIAGSNLRKWYVSSVKKKGK
ncbi:hypothetical protein ACH3XW_46520 [Acanthocheilonema viteae]